jgi:predicted ATPase
VGDSFCAAFSAAGPAAAAVLTAQRALGDQAWPTGRPVRVRMGLHSGVCEERDGDYFGPTVNRAARLEAAAHGGQVLISGSTAELLSGSLADDASLRDLGLHRLKDLGRPEQVFQLEAPFLADQFPPISSLDNPELPNNLPSLLSAFVGRDAELAQVREMLRASRLVTLTGAGGSGKTRLALQAAAELLDGFPDGVWLAELAPLTDGSQIATTVAAVLGIHHLAARPATEAVASALAGQHALILLDNCEHLIDAAVKFTDAVIRQCPGVRFLATSREPLGIDGELVYRVPSLSLPPPDADAVDELTASDAVRLFAERAGAHQPGFALNAAAAPLVVTVCRRLDGIPLALELAAARLSSMSLAQVAARLDQRFRLLTGGSRNAMPRQQTLQATVDWSFGLLNPAERETLGRLSVFASGFDLEAAEAICTSDSIDVLDVMDLLGSLVDKSLVVADHTAGLVRYHLLETIRQYSAQELLRAAGDAGALEVRGRHADYYLGLARQAEPCLTGHDQAKWLLRLDAEWDNVRAAFAHLAAEDRRDDVLRLASAVYRFSLSRGHPDALGYVRPIIEDASAEPTALLANALVDTAQLIGLLHRASTGEMATAKAYAERAVTIARAIGDRRTEARAMSTLGASAEMADDETAAKLLAEESIAIGRELGDPQLLAELLQPLGNLRMLPSEERRRIHAEALACARRCGDVLIEAAELGNLCSLDLHAGRIDESVAYLEEAVALADQFGGELVSYYFRANLTILRLVQGRHAEAAELLRHCLRASRRLGPEIALSGELLFCAACCATWRGDYVRAARLHGAGDADIAASLELRTINWSDAEDDLRRRDQAKLRQELGDAAYEEAYRSGAQLPHPQAMDLALGRQIQA